MHLPARHGAEHGPGDLGGEQHGVLRQDARIVRVGVGVRVGVRVRVRVAAVVVITARGDVARAIMRRISFIGRSGRKP